MELEGDVLKRVRTYQSLSQWERSEVGRDLRRLGLSYGEIMELIPVKKSSLATWCRDVELTEDQIEAIRRRRAQEPGIPRDTQRKRRREIELIKAQAKLEAEHLIDDPAWTMGVSMYWGEGSKATRQLSMANSDPAVLRMFINWATRFLPPETGWRAKLNLHANNAEPAARRWWSEEARSTDLRIHEIFHQARRHRSSKEPPALKGLRPDKEEEHRRLSHDDGMGRVPTDALR